MPYLSRERNIFPNDLLDQVQYTDASAQWWMIECKPQQEKALARVLAAQEAPFYLPLTIKAGRRPGLANLIFLPRWPGYVWVASQAAQYLAIRNPSAAHATSVSDVPALLKQLHAAWLEELVHQATPAKT